MKKIVSLVLVLIMVLSFSSIALAASPTGGTTTGGTTAGGAPAKVVEVKGASAEGKAALEAAVAEELKGKLAEGESTEVVAAFSCAEKGRIVSDVVQQLWPAVESGQVGPVVDRVLPLAEAAEAHRLLEQGDVIGKVVLQVR